MKLTSPGCRENVLTQESKFTLYFLDIGNLFQFSQDVMLKVEVTMLLEKLIGYKSNLKIYDNFQW